MVEATAKRDAAALKGAHYTRIVPSRGWVGIHLKELWDYRELLFFLAWRDVKVRYKQTALREPAVADNAQNVGPVQVRSQILEELLGRRLVEGGGRLAVLCRIEILLQLAVRHTTLKGMHVKLLAGEFDGSDAALGLEPEKVAPIHPRACVILGSIVAQHWGSKDGQSHERRSPPGPAG